MDIEKIKKGIESYGYVDRKLPGDHYEFEVFCDYRDELSESTLADISRSDYPRDVFDKCMNDMLVNAEDYYYPELLKEIKKELDDDEWEESEDEIKEWVDEHVSWFMPEDHFNKDVDVVISLDVGDMNYDFTKCNILNWYGTCDGGIGELESMSPIHWLASQQGKLDELKSALGENIDQGTDFQTENGYSNFTKTVIQELQNACSHMNTLIFGVKMPLFDFIKLKELIKADEELNKSYTYEDRKGENKFTVTKDAMCGLYDIWSGGGSVLEIELEKDVEIPTKAIFDVWIDCRGCKANGRGYDVYDVYGITSSAYTGSVKFNENRKEC